ncbi:MAG TPA: helix-turn-helix transcriptional regulator [Vicinamibacterales bacterium]|nr:helix-turn-helix transcriptional regulator [Vicinamibacterales bacterium]
MSPHPYKLITQERQRRRLTQGTVGRLAKEFGAHRALTQSEVSQIELGRLNPTPDELAALGRLFGVEPPSLLLEVVIKEEQPA